MLGNCPPTCHAYTEEHGFVRHPRISPRFPKAVSEGHLEEAIHSLPYPKSAKTWGCGYVHADPPPSGPGLGAESLEPWGSPLSGVNWRDPYPTVNRLLFWRQSQKSKAPAGY